MKDKPYPPVYYADYLKLDQLLSSQKLKSDEYENHAHDEMLFIIVHQVYELWFKQILFELDYISEMFRNDVIDERNIGKTVSRLKRITEIQRLLIDQLKVLETMTPMSFLEFRDYLVPASGFQSVQFRLIENKLGIKKDSRVSFAGKSYYSLVKEPHQGELLESEKEESLKELIDKWLSRIPFIKTKNFDFMNEYKKSIDGMLDNERQIIENNPSLSEEKREKQLEEFEKTSEGFNALLNKEDHNKLIEEGHKSLSYEATVSALFINLYRHEPILHLPYRLLSLLMEIDKNFTTWRYNHAMMVHGMIGAKVGTGGSSGHHYLLKTAEKHKVFKDLFDLSTYFIPSNSLPELPDSLKEELGFYYTYKRKENGN